MINLTLDMEDGDVAWDVEDVACPLNDDMRVTDGSRSCVRGEEIGEGKGRVDGGVQNTGGAYLVCHRLRVTVTARVPVALGV